MTSLPDDDIDPLDQPSDCYVEEWSYPLGRKIKRVLSFRELSEACAHDMVLWDTLTEGNREANQIANDPHYRPIAPGAGHAKQRRWRG